MPTKMVSHEEQGSAKVLPCLTGAAPPHTGTIAGTLMWRHTYVYQGLMHWFPEYNANTQAQLPTRL